MSSKTQQINVTSRQVGLRAVYSNTNLGTCESFFFVRIELRIESAVYHGSRNTT